MTTFFHTMKGLSGCFMFAELPTRSALTTFNHISEPPPLGPCDSDFLQFFQEKGMHPYRLHVGIRYRPGCDECLGRLCHKNCRADVRSVLAESQNKPTIMARSEVIRIEAAPDRITRTIVRQGDKQITIQAKVFVLAAGAIHTPKVVAAIQE